jgi:hypothetical protein
LPDGQRAQTRAQDDSLEQLALQHFHVAHLLLD